jgi:L-amino acid N-acyltransferase YncA
MPDVAEPIIVRPMGAEDWPAVEAIYAAGIAGGHATFETQPPSWEQFDSTRLTGHRHVAVDAVDRVLGWVAATAYSSRSVYAGVVEESVYVDPEAHGRGVGRRLLQALIESTESAGVWTVQAGIFPENRISIALHHALGFRTVGVRERLGRMAHGPLAGQWRDVLLLERRSARV